MTDEIFRLKKRGGSLTWQFLQVILPTESPRDSKWQLRTVTWSILHSYCWRTHRGIQTGISMQWRDLFTVRITDGIRLSAKVNIWPLYRPSPSLFLLLLPHPNSRLLQTTTPPKKNLPLLSITSHICWSFVVTASVFWFTDKLLSVFVSNSIFLNFNI